jgi:hypothetical protein
VVDRVGDRSTAASRVLDDAVFEVEDVLGNGVGLGALVREAVEEGNTSAGRDVVAGPTSLNPNFRNACAPSPTVGASQVRTRVS